MDSAEDTAAADVVELTGPDGEPLPYGEAADELESILADLETSTVDVDRLTEQVARANLLIRYCQARLDGVRNDVNEVLSDLAADGAARERDAVT